MKRSHSASPTPSWSSLSSQDSDHGGASTTRTSPTHRSHKHARAEENALPPLADQVVIECTVGPICSVSPQTFMSQQALQSHYIKAHSFICRGLVSPRQSSQRSRVGAAASVNVGSLGGGQGEDTEVQECGKIFPEERLLELHIIENHDPIALVKQSQGEHIFECLLPRDICSQRFATPKERRRHMVLKHHYSKQYFFSVVNHGIGDLLQRFGPGVSLIRPTWAPRTPPPPPSSGPSQTSLAQARPGSSSEVTHGAPKYFGSPKPRTRPKQRIIITSPDVRRRIPRSNNSISDSAVDADSENGEHNDNDDDDGGMSSDNRQPQQTHSQAVSEPKVAPIPNQMSSQNVSSATSAKANEDTEMDDLALSLADTSLGFVPRGVRKKQRERGKAQLADVARESDDLMEMG